jgi:TATA-box binding protein (TBP) (component of TFIID and TFIIIB)
MSVEAGVDVKNIKLHFRIRDSKIGHLLWRLDELSNSDQYDIKEYHNFTVFRGEFVFIIFFKSGFVNATKVKSYEEVSKCVNYFCGVFHFSLKHIKPSVKIDNITCSGDLNYEINLLDVTKCMGSDETCRFSPQFFPACFIRVNSFGTAIVFSNGSYSLVGSKCLAHVLATQSRMIAIIQKSLTMTKKDTMCAKTAE